MFWIIFIYGLLLGSFFNVVGYRLPNDMSIVKPGSFCPKCSHSLRWYELIPIISYVIQLGKCRKCGSHISWIYPIIEISTALLYGVSYLVFGFSYEFLIALLISSFLIIIIVSDINYLIIPDEVTIFFSILMIILSFFLRGFTSTLFYILDGVIMFLFMYLIMYIGGKIFKEEALGGGDVKLMFFIGLTLGIQNSILTIFLGSLFSFPFALIGTYMKKLKYIPFGPFLLSACLIIFMLNLNLVNLLESII